jgi:hypothetical protein
MKSTQAYQALFAEFNGDKWDSVQSAFADVDQTMAEWICPGFIADVDPRPGEPPPGCILWYGNHILACKEGYLVAVRTSNNTSESIHRPLPGIAEVIDGLNDVTERFLATLRDMDDEFLSRNVSGTTMTVASYLNMAVRHEIWHAGQVALLKRLYKYRER